MTDSIIQMQIDQIIRTLEAIDRATESQTGVNERMREAVEMLMRRQDALEAWLAAKFGETAADQPRVN